ncbi:MAG: copper chaperone PCu(A)C [Betaproteobacteria bacterium]|nr:copper chaperone PCu(A)C [Betaproteobacteria bacterium]
MNMWNWLLILGLSLSANAWAADIKIDEAWTRATAPGQHIGGAFMTLTADADLSLVDAASPVASSVEMHNMVMDKDVMVMRRIDRIALPKGKAVPLAPGGLHLMLFGLKAPLKTGERVPLTLTVRDAKGKTRQIEVKAEVREIAGGMMHRHH